MIRDPEDIARGIQSSCGCFARPNEARVCGVPIVCMHGNELQPWPLTVRELRDWLAALPVDQDDELVLVTSDDNSYSHYVSHVTPDALSVSITVARIP